MLTAVLVITILALLAVVGVMLNKNRELRAINWNLERDQASIIQRRLAEERDEHFRIPVKFATEWPDDPVDAEWRSRRRPADNAVPVFLCTRPESCRCKDRVRQQDAADFVGQLKENISSDSDGSTQGEAQ